MWQTLYNGEILFAWSLYKKTYFCGMRNGPLATCFMACAILQLRRVACVFNMSLELLCEGVRTCIIYNIPDLFWKGPWRKDLNENHGTYWGMRAVAGVQDVHSQETYHVIRYFHTFLKRSNLEWQDILMPNLCTISDLTVDKPWNDLSRAWNDLSMAWNGLSRAWTGVPEFSTYFIFLLQQNFGSPKRSATCGFQSGYSWWHKNSKTYSFKAVIIYPWSLFKSFVALFIFFLVFR